MEFAWLPIGTALGPNAESGRVLRAESSWQLLATNTPSRIALLLDVDAPDAPPWWPAELSALQDVFACDTTTDGARTFPFCLIETEPGARTLGDIALRNPSIRPEELCSLLDSIESLRERHADAEWENALFIPEAGFLLGTQEDPAEDRRAVITALLSGGVRDPALTSRRIREFNPCLTEVEIDQALKRLGFGPSGRRRVVSVRPPEAFALPGQAQLEKAFREHVIDIAHRPAEYAKLGVRPPNGILLKGPAGTGKSHARRLADFLGWPVFDINLASIGSSFLHETSRRIADVFAKAETAAPAIVLLEEMDALGGARDRTHSAGVEEVNTLLRQVENAGNRAILVIGTTNRPEALDPALLRRGRFDLSIAVEKLDAHQARAMLDGLLSERPRAAGLDAATIAARLAGRPASDLAWVVEEAARLAVRSGKDAIDEICLASAVRSLS